jgi:hypothetical protein
MEAPDRQRFVRRGRLKWAALGFLQGVIPVLVAAGLLLRLHFNVWLLGCAAVLIGLAVAHWPKMSNAVDLIEVQGATIRFRRFWTRRWVEVMPETISHVGMARADQRIVGPGQQLMHQTPPPSYAALFSNGKKLEVSLHAFPGSETVIELLASHFQTGWRFPLRMHGLYLGNMTVYPNAESGTGWVYYEESGENGGTVHYYLYHKNNHDISNGICPLLEHEFLEAKNQVVPGLEGQPTPNPISHVADSRVRVGTASEFEFLCSDYQLVVSGKPRLARLFITRYAGYFLKIQVTANVARPGFPALCDAAVKVIEERLQAPQRQMTNVGQRASPGEASRV